MVRAAAAVAFASFLGAAALPGQQPGGVAPPVAEPRAAVTAEQLRAAIDTLGNLEFAVRTGAARTVRRASPAVAVPALLRAVRQHADGYVRFRALVLLSGFNDPGTRDLMAQAIGDKNDRLRTVGYTFFEHNPDPAVLPRLLESLNREESEFVRPALTRAVAAHGDDARARSAMSALVMKGQAFFRSVVIEALGDHRAAYALKPLIEVAKVDGPLQDDAALALGRIGDKAALPTLAAIQRTAARETQPSIAAAFCLLGVNCASHQPFIVQSLDFGIRHVGFQELVRSSAAALAALAVSGRVDAAVELVQQGGPSRDPARAAVALALGTVALRNTDVLLKALETGGMLDPGIGLLRDAFDMLEEDFEEERFYANVRRAFWQAPTGSPRKRVAETLVQQLEF